MPGVEREPDACALESQFSTLEPAPEPPALDSVVENRYHSTNILVNPENSLYLHNIEGSPSGCGSLGIPEVSQVEQGEHRYSYVYEPMRDSLLLYCCCWTVYCAGRKVVRVPHIWTDSHTHTRTRRHSTHAYIMTFRFLPNLATLNAQSTHHGA